MREAINAGQGPRIEFDIPMDGVGFYGTVWTIQPPGSALPEIRRCAELEAATQTDNQGDTNPGGPEVLLDGALSSYSRREVM